MKSMRPFYGLSALLLGACATSQQSTMSAAELSDCLQPNRRGVVEVGGLVTKPPAKKPPTAPGEAAKPVADTPAPKPAKPELMPYSEMTYVQGNSAFDPMNAVLKPEGRAELDKLVATLSKRAVQVNSIIVSGHVDRLEEAAGAKALSEERARAVKDYLVSKGVNEKAIFWEGKQARDPVPVTKFCT
ncbi:MAG: OmpA family protein [Burkholderiales bacterium]